MDHSQKPYHLQKNIVSGMVLAGGNIVLHLVSYPIFLKWLGAEVFGLWSALSIVLAFSVVGRLGIDNAITKYVAAEYGKGDIAGVKRYLSNAFLLLLLSGVVVLTAAFLLRNSIIQTLGITKTHGTIARTLVPSMAALSVFIYFVQALNGALKGLGRVDLANYYFLLGRAVSIAAALLLFMLGLGIWGLFWAMVVCYILMLVMTVLSLTRRIGFCLVSAQALEIASMKELCRFGGTMTASSLVSMFLVPFNKAMIARYIGLSEVAYFEIALRSVMQVRSFFETGIRAIMPEISKVTASHFDTKRVRHILQKAYQVVFCLGLPCFALLFLLAPTLFSLWLARMYATDIGVLFRILLIGYSVNLCSLPAYYYLMGLGKVKFCFLAHLIQGVLNGSIILLLVLLGIKKLYVFASVLSFALGVSALLLIYISARHRKTLSVSLCRSVKQSQDAASFRELT